MDASVKTYHVDTFTKKLFSGNPAMVFYMEHWLSDDQLQLMARENHLPATAFLVKQEGKYYTRWFTPEYEIDLCGHGTLATGYVLFNILEPSLQKIDLHSPAGVLQIIREGDLITMSLPVKKITAVSSSKTLTGGLGAIPEEVYEYQSERCLAVFKTEEEVSQLKPDMKTLQQLPYRGVIVTAPGNESDFVSRVFYPKKLIWEDAVTGSSHCLLVPYWARKLNKIQFDSRQLSQRGGKLLCKLQGDKVAISGSAVLYTKGGVEVWPAVYNLDFK